MGATKNITSNLIVNEQGQRLKHCFDIVRQNGSVRADANNKKVEVNGITFDGQKKKPLNGLSGIMNNHVVGEAVFLEHENAVGIYEVLAAESA